MYKCSREAEFARLILTQADATVDLMANIVFAWSTNKTHLVSDRISTIDIN